MFPNLPRAFPNAEWSQLGDIFKNKPRPSTSTSTSAPPLSASDQWVEQELGYYESEYTKINELNVCVTTFNVGCKKPTLPLHNLCALRSAADPDHPVDVIAVALQEIDMSATAMFREETEASVPWVQGLSAAIGADNVANGSSSKYYALPHKQLVGLLLCVYVRRELLPFVQEYAIVTVATGALGSLGNKGAVGAHLVIHRTSLCIITAHLAAGQNNISKRNEDINNILKDMDFNAAKRTELQMGSNGTVSALDAMLLLPELHPRDHHMIIVAGDLNYRLELTYEEALQLTDRKDIAELLKHDQLKKEMGSPHTPWEGFRDLTPTFLPTYRFDIGTNTYDTSEKKRIPSFTDRILVWCRRPSMESLVKVDHLAALLSVMSSDHKPVQAVMRLPVRVEVPAEKRRTTQMLQDKVRSLGLEVASCGKTSINCQRIDFGAQQFHQCGRRETVTVTNNGDCAAVVRVLRQRGQDDSEGAWLRVTPLEFVLTPGESQNVTVETLIDPRCMTWLGRWRPYDGRGRIALHSVLLLCVRNGPVHAVECSCQLKPSIFGNSLENVMLLGGLSCEDAYHKKGDLSTLLRALRPQIPKELWYMAEVISQHPRASGLFTQSSSADECRRIMHALDTSEGPLPQDADVHCVADCLLAFLTNLQEPVVPFSMFTSALAAGKAHGKAPIAFLRQLPIMHANLWIYIMSLLNFLLRPVNARSNELTVEVLSQVFSAVLIIRPTAAQGMNYVRLAQGGGVNQQVRQQMRQEKEDARALVEYFLATPPALLQY